jgi:hypothetical protein
VAGLVTAGAGLLFKQKQMCGGKALDEPVGSGQPNDSSADDGDFSAHLFRLWRNGDHSTGTSERRVAYLNPRRVALC